MANEPRQRQGRTPATPPNTAARGVILVVAAVFVAILLFNAGGGESTDTGKDRTPAEQATGSDKTTTTTSTIPVVTTPPANLNVVVGNGSGVTGRAKKTSDKLAGLGYSKIKAVDGKSTTTTTVYFVPGMEDDALALVRLMGLPDERAQPMPGETPLQVPVGEAQIVVLVGTDFDPDTAPVGVTSTPTN